MRVSQVTSFALAFAVVWSIAFATPAIAQRSRAQRLTVYVPQSIAIVAPSPLWIRHDQTSNRQEFPPQTWHVRGNISQGVSVNIHVDTPFIHLDDDSQKRDVTLSLATGQTVGNADWSITTPFDETNYAQGDTDATVTARSDDVGAADLLVSVSFITGDLELLKAGVYRLVVTGTVAANQ